MCCPSDNGALGQSLEAMLQGGHCCLPCPAFSHTCTRRACDLVGTLPLCSTSHTNSIPCLPTSWLHTDPGQSVLRSRLPNSAVDARCQLYKVWPGVQLGPGETMQWPLLLHATSSGRLAIHSVWYCEPTVSVRTGRRHVHKEAFRMESAAQSVASVGTDLAMGSCLHVTQPAAASCPSSVWCHFGVRCAGTGACDALSHAAPQPQRERCTPAPPEPQSQHLPAGPEAQGHAAGHQRRPGQERCMQKAAAWLHVCLAFVCCNNSSVSTLVHCPGTLLCAGGRCGAGDTGRSDLPSPRAALAPVPCIQLGRSHHRSRSPQRPAFHPVVLCSSHSTSGITARGCPHQHPSPIVTAAR